MMQMRWNIGTKPLQNKYKDKKRLVAVFDPIADPRKAHRDFDRSADEFDVAKPPSKPSSPPHSSAAKPVPPRMPPKPPPPPPPPASVNRPSPDEIARQFIFFPETCKNLTLQSSMGSEATTIGQDDIDMVRGHPGSRTGTCYGLATAVDTVHVVPHTVTQLGRLHRVLTRAT